MITVIDKSNNPSLKKQLEAIQTKGAILITLDPKSHTIQINQQSFSLNYRDSTYQSLLSTPHPLLKAIGNNPGSILDACGGFGKDSFILAHQGFQIITCEHNLLIYTLLTQAIESYTKGSHLNWATYFGDAIQHMENQSYDTIYLDPMFNLSRSAKPKLAMQIIQSLTDDTPFTAWHKAWECAKKRLVIKHHQLTPSIPLLPKPNQVIKGKRNIRYDIYLKEAI